MWEALPLDRLVDRTHRLTLIGIGLLGLALTGVVTVVFDIVLGGWAALAAFVIATVVFVVVWVVMPLRERRHTHGDT